MNLSIVHYIVAMALFAFVALNLAAQTFSGGTGTSDDPYQITSRADLDSLAVAVNGGKGYQGKYFKLMTDIDMSAGYVSGTAPAFTPIGSGSLQSFWGTFNGNGHIIDNLYVSIANKDNVGFFGYNSGIIVNLTLSNLVVNGTRDHVGGLVGYHAGTLSGCHVSGTVSGKEKVGGLIGNNAATNISYCSADVAVSGGMQVGGLIGRNDNSSIRYCSATGNVRGTGDCVGGLIGYASPNSAASYCFTTGNATGNDMVGGLIGDNQEANVTHCYVTGDVAGANFVGGLIGRHTLANAQYCYATGDIRGNAYVGGLVGLNYGSFVADVYATGVVTGNAAVGGLVGEAVSADPSDDPWEMISNGAFDVTRNPDGIGYAGILPLSTTEMQTQRFVDSLNVNAIGTLPFMKMESPVNGGYPVFGWQTVIPPSAPNVVIVGNTAIVSWNYAKADSIRIWRATVGITDSAAVSAWLPVSNMSFIDKGIIHSINYAYWLEAAENDNGALAAGGPFTIVTQPKITFLTVGGTLDVTLDSFGINTFKKQKPYVEYWPPFPGKKNNPKKLATKLVANPDEQSGTVTLKKGFPLWNKQAFKVARKAAPNEFTAEILTSNPDIQKDFWLVELKIKGADSVLTFGVCPPILGAVSDSIIIEKDLYLVIPTAYVNDKRKAKFEYRHNGRIKSASAPIVKGKKLAIVSGRSIALANAIQNAESSRVEPFTEIRVFKLKQPIQARVSNGETIHLVVDNTFGLATRIIE